MRKNLPLWILIVFQLFILAGMFVNAFYPIWLGQEIRLRVTAHKWHDVVRGNYANLTYPFSSLQIDTLPNDLQQGKLYYYGDVLYLQLEKKGNFYEPVGLYHQCPEGSLCLRVTPTHTYVHDKAYLYLHINLQAGIESYFIDYSRARYLDSINSLPPDSNSSQLSVLVRVAPNGTARITKLLF
ncbi:MAG: GDYXXLXY domain-containing protein [Cytophagales bacterium]|nr:GDYXXLXY domain-containing protein [Bernardetiaceae bacterium]MDW8210482.1 GDYXXLXY domain-containing protein [Cytophagales bacterium]